MATAAPRVHHQWLPDRLRLEPGLYDGDVATDLRARGHELERTGSVGNVQFIRVTDLDLEAACDPRKGGRPAGM